MQSTSELYKTLIADPGHVKECRLIVAGEEYASDRIVSMETDGGLFEQDTVCVGSAVSRQLEVVLYDAGEIPKGAKLIPEYRIRLGDQVSEWKRKGVYYIDTREPRAALGTLTIHAFDDFMNMEAEWVTSQDLEFPMPMDRAAAEIARYYGITIDSRSRLRSDYFIDYPTPGTSGRTIFKWIAAAHGGNWTMTDNGEARLVRLQDLDSETGSLVTERGRVILIGGRPILVGKTAEKACDGPSDKVFVGPNAADVSAPPTLNPISKIVILVDDDNYFEAGDDSGLTLELTCPYGTQAMANDLINELRGYRHVPLEAQDALIDPAAEIGDGVTVNGVYTILASMATTFDALMPSDIGAPGQRETESEIGRYYGPVIKSFNRSIARTRSYITKTAEQIRLEVSKEVEGLTASFDVKLGEIRGEITDAVNGLSASVDVKLGGIQAELTDDINDLSTDVTLKYNELTASLSSGLDGLSADFALKLTGLETSFRDDQEKQSAAFDVKLDGLSATFSDEQTKQDAAFDVKLEGLSATFSNELEGVSSEFKTGLSGLSTRIESVENKVTEDLATYEETVNKSIGDLQSQIDGNITTWFYSYEPTTGNAPASLWATDAEKIKHLGDVFYVVDNEEKGGQAYRWEYVGGAYRWSLIEDVEVSKALADAAKAQDTADKKRRVFTERPTPPYDVGDLWSQGPDGDLMRCKTARSSGSYLESDWEKASDYTDDSYAKEKYAELNVTLEGITTEVGDLGGRVSTVEQTASNITTQIKGLGDRTTTLEQTDESFKTQISGIDGRVSTVEQTASGLTTDVSDLSGKYTSLNQTVSGISSTVNGLDGRVTTAQQTADKVGWIIASGTNSTNFELTSRMAKLVADEIDLTGYVTINSLKTAGSTTINGSNITTGTISAERINLTGAITWGDLNSTVQSEINNRGISESRAHTLISGDLVASPRIEGAKIYGGIYYNTDADTQLFFDRENGKGYFYVISGGLNIVSVSAVPSTTSYDLQVGGVTVLYTNSGSRTILPRETWDFSNATVTGLKIA